MEMFGLLLVLGLIASLILPWVNLGRISGQRNELNRLKRELWELQNKEDAREFGAAGEVEPTSDARSAPVPAVEKEVDVAQAGERSCRAAASVSVTESEPRASVGAGLSPNSTAAVSDAASEEELEACEPTELPCETTRSVSDAAPQDWFSKLAIWVGGIALLMAGFYMIKYSIDSGWMTPAVRLWLTTGFGGLLCGAGFVIGIKSAMLANERIGQALSGAGIACLYFAAYAAVHLYSFLSAGQGFVAMFVVTVLAVALSLKNGAPIALMGLVGGFLTPWLMSTGSNDTVMLFSYLFLLFCGAQFLCMRRGWWALLLGSLVGAYLWSAFVIVGHFNGQLDHLEGTLIFVLGICGVNAIWALLAKRDILDDSAARLLTSIRLLTWSGGLVQGFILVLVGGFAAVDMMLFSLLSVGALVLAVLKEDDFIWAAWLALVAVTAATLSNAEPMLWSWLVVPMGLMAMFFVVGHWRALSSDRTLVWRSLSAVAAMIVVPILYLNRECIVSENDLVGRSWFWMATIWAGLLALAGEHLLRREKDTEIAGEYSVFALILFSFGLWAWVPADYLAHTAAVLLVSVALYWKWRRLGKSLLAISVPILAWIALMWLHAGDVCAYFFREEFHNGTQQDGLAMIAWALGLIGVAVALWCGRANETWSDASRQLLRRLFGVIALLCLVGSYQWVDQTYMPKIWTGAVVEGGLTTLLATTAVLCIVRMRQWGWCQQVSAILAGLVGLRVIVLHLTDTGAAGDRFFFNALILQFGIPFITAFFLAWRSGEQGSERLRRVYQLAAMLLGFVWATFLVQDYYGGSQLVDGHNSSAEIYTYSVVWLLLAVAYQAVGLWRNQSTIHVGSLILLLLTIGKVFLVDASELEGLFRVLSFLGLGFALIGIGFFYNKVVFARREQ